MTGPVLVDTHAHLDFEAFDPDRDEVMERARRAGLGAVINVTLEPSRLPRGMELARRYRGVYLTAGIHPHEARNWVSRLPEAEAAMAKALGSGKVVAVGEAGLDFYRDRSPRADQEEVFRFQIRLAAAHDRPLIIHNRQADDEVLRILDEEGPVPAGVVIHCFTGDEDFARRCVERGFYLGFGGVTTYPGAPEVRRAAAAVPARRILLETDCPFLAPQRWRGQRNEPAYTAEVAAAVAEARGEPVDKIIAETGENARRLFGIELHHRLGEIRHGEKHEEL